MGVSLMLVIDLVLFGFAGLAIWAVQMAVDSRSSPRA